MESKKQKQCSVCKKLKSKENDFQKNGSSKALSDGKTKQYYNSFCKSCKSEKAKKGKQKKYIKLTRKERLLYAEINLFHLWKPSTHALQIN